VRIAICMALIVLAPGCTETRVVRYNPFLGGLPGAESGMPVVRGWDYQDPTAIPESQIVQQTPDGKPRLIAKTGRHLILHMYNTIEDGQRDLFVEQVLSSVTRAECHQRGVDPGTLYDTLAENRLDLYDLFNLMPMAERTPGVVMTPVGDGAYRVKVTGLGTANLRWTGFDMIMEGGSWRLRWVVDR
jgi:hypothetical protein